MKGLKIFNLGRSRLAGITLACMGMLLGNVAYCANLVATSPEFKLSLRDDGIRQSTGVEILTFGSLWDGDENATVTIERDGVVIAENLTGSGDKEWRVTEDGTYKLTHTTYTNGIASKVETATFVVSDQVATSPEFKLSLRDDGIRQSTGVETLTFGSLWDGDENATVTIERDGVVIAENLTGSGDKEWRVTESGTYKLTHTTYTNGVVSKVETATFVVSDQVATSPEFKLSLQDDGIRLSDGSEPLLYSSLWDGDENATVTIAQDGVAIAENLTGEGDKEWRVTEEGTYKLTHTTYTNGIAGKVETATFVVAGLSVEFRMEMFQLTVILASMMD